MLRNWGTGRAAHDIHQRLSCCALTGTLQALQTDATHVNVIEGNMAFVTAAGMHRDRRTGM